MNPRTLLACVVVACTLPACSDADETVTAPAPAPSTQETPALPDGWRWESYREVVVAVPGDWSSYSSSGSRMTQWCVSRVKPPQPGVARPGASTAAGCGLGRAGKASSGSLLRNGGTFVAFTGAKDGVRDEGDRIVVRLGGTAVVIQAPAALREQIAATASQRTDTDHNGCPLTHPISDDPAWRPSPVDPAAFAEVTSMTACRYDFRGDSESVPPGPTLVSSIQVTGPRASSTATAIEASPAGGGPDNVGRCIGSSIYGHEAIVVRLDRTGGKPAHLAVRFSGCEHNGIDDGTVVHRLTFDAARPFFEGANFVSSGHGNAAKAEVLHPESAAGAREKERLVDGRR